MVSHFPFYDVSTKKHAQKKYVQDMNMILRNKMCNKYTDFKNPQSKILKVNRIFHWSLAISIDVK